MKNMLQQQLLASFYDETNSQKYRYLLIDNLASVSDLDFIHLNNINELLGSNAITTVLRPDLSHSPELCPKLIRLAKPHQKTIDEKIIQYSVIQAINELNRSKRYICSWFTSEQPPEVVAELIIHIGTYTAKYCDMFFLPIYEPFRMQLLHESTQISALWLPVMLSFSDEYYYLDLQSKLRVIKRPASIPPEIDLFISESAQCYQKNMRSIFQLYMSWLRYCQAVERDIDDETLMRIASAYYDAHKIGLTDPADKSIYTLMTLRYGELATQIELKQAIDNAIEEPGTLAESFKAMNRKVFLSLK